MKTILLATVFISTIAIAENVITITPGSSIELKPQESTKIVCTGTSGYKCYCRSFSNIWLLYLRGQYIGQKDSLLKDDIPSEQECFQQLKVNPSCI